MIESGLTTEQITDRISELGEWFHNINLRGISTAPHHFLGDYPRLKWEYVAPLIPENLEGATVLDIGCNAGFYSAEFKRRGASRVLGIDIDDRYLAQAHLVAEVLGVDIELEKCSAYDLEDIAGEFDYVLFMGVFYHLRHPLYALDQVFKKVKGHLIFQTMIRGASSVPALQQDYSFWNKDIFSIPNFPCMYFIENRYAGDPSNWWIPNQAGIEAMLRSAGFAIKAHPEAEIWMCKRSTPESKWV